MGQRRSRKTHVQTIQAHANISRIDCSSRG
jgi:hypothetical protein